MELLKAGAVLPGVCELPQAHNYGPDLAVFRCQVGQATMPMLAPPLPPAMPAIGDRAMRVPPRG